jgi:hypothetical protein
MNTTEQLRIALRALTAALNDGSDPDEVRQRAEFMARAVTEHLDGQDDLAMMEVTDEMINRFLSWPLPDSVCSDLCVTQRDYGKAQGWPKRVGTNLLTADEARQMLEYVLSLSA